MTPESLDLLMERLDRIAEAIEAVADQLARLDCSIEKAAQAADESRAAMASALVAALGDLTDDVFIAGGIK